MNVGIIGLGRAGLVHLGAWQHVDGVRLAGVADPSPEARAHAEALGIRS